VFELSVQREFCAAHAITMAGVREPAHGHTWKVLVIVAGEELDDEGLLCDFHDLEAQLEAVIEPLHNGDLNRTPPFDRTNPTAEHVARHIGQSMAARLPAGIALRCARVTEAPGCTASYRP
jgi:6-pyruvoyltetrahydropterin/6-carboxytetrahydropterin synthase